MRPATSDAADDRRPSGAQSDYATGHYRVGVLLAPLTAQLVATPARQSRRSGLALSPGGLAAAKPNRDARTRGAWIAQAERENNAEHFGIECAGSSADEAAARLTRWLDWQEEHVAALDALQQAERAYHRTIAGSAFANPTEGPTAIELQKESLDALEAARIRLDDVRARRPS